MCITQSCVILFIHLNTNIRCYTLYDNYVRACWQSSENQFLRFRWFIVRIARNFNFIKLPADMKL